MYEEKVVIYMSENAVRGGMVFGVVFMYFPLVGEVMLGEAITMQFS